MISTFESLASRACACPDTACAQAVDAELATVFDQFPSAAFTLDPADSPLSPDAQSRARQAGEDLVRCIVARNVVPYSLGRILLHQVRAFRDQMCACTSPECAQRVAHEVARQADSRRPFPADEATEAVMTEVVQEYAACATPLLAEAGAQAISALDKLRDRACDCTTAACADQVQADFNEFLDEYRDVKGDQASAARVEQLASEMSQCLATARTHREGEASP